MQRPLNLGTGLLLLTLTSQAQAYVGVQSFVDGSTRITIGGSEALSAIKDALPDTETGHLKCDIDTATSFEICQVAFDKDGYGIRDFTVQYGVDRNKVHYSDTNGVTVHRSDTALQIFPHGASQIKHLEERSIPLHCNEDVSDVTFPRHYYYQTSIPCALHINLDGLVVESR